MFELWGENFAKLDRAIANAGVELHQHGCAQKDAEAAAKRFRRHERLHVIVMSLLGVPVEDARLLLGPVQNGESEVIFRIYSSNDTSWWKTLLISLAPLVIGDTSRGDRRLAWKALAVLLIDQDKS